MFYQTHQIEEMHADNYIAYDNGTYTVYDSNFNIVAVYVNTYTRNMVINGVQRIA